MVAPKGGWLRVLWNCATSPVPILPPSPFVLLRRDSCEAPLQLWMEHHGSQEEEEEREHSAASPSPPSVLAARRLSPANCRLAPFHDADRSDIGAQPRPVVSGEWSAARGNGGMGGS